MKLEIRAKRFKGKRRQDSSSSSSTVLNLHFSHYEAIKTSLSISPVFIFSALPLFGKGGVHEHFCSDADCFLVSDEVWRRVMSLGSKP